jgi:alpha-1,2-mannosyltransferase
MVARVSSLLERLGPAIPGQPRRKASQSRLLVVGVVAFVVVLGAWLGYAFSRPLTTTLYPSDLRVYLDGGLIVRHSSPPYDGKLQYPLYDWPTGNSANALALKFTYTPFAALFFAVVSIIPWSILPRVAQVANLVFLFAAAWFTMDLLGYKSRQARLGGALLGAAAGLLTEPVFRTMYLGQINLLLMALILWDMSQPDRRRWKGFATGLAAGIKLVPLIFIPYLLFTRRFRAAAMAIAGFAVSVLLGFVILPGDSRDFWLNGLFYQDGRTGFVGWGGNQSLRGLITRLAGSISAGTGPWVLAVVIATVAGIACAVMLDRAGHTMLAVLATALVGLLDSPISWDHHWVWVVPGMMVAGHYAARAWQAGRRRAAFGCGGVGAALLLIFAPWPGNLWSMPPTGPGNFVDGLIWAGPDSPVKTYVADGDEPWFKEYHWAGLQNLAGNAYILTGIAMLVLLVVIALRTRGGSASLAGVPGSAVPAASATQDASPATQDASPAAEDVSHASSEASPAPSDASPAASV